MSDTYVAEETRPVSYKISHLLTIAGVKGRVARKDNYDSALFSCPDDPDQTKFKIMLRFGSEKKDVLSAFLAPQKGTVYVIKATFQARDVTNFRFVTSSYEDKLLSATGMGFIEFYRFSHYKLKDDTLRIRCDFHYESKPMPGSAVTVAVRDPNLQSDLLKMLNDGIDADVNLVVRGKKIAAHKAILKVRSEYFRGLFESGMMESRKNEVEIKDVSPELFQRFLEFLYTGAPPKSPAEAAWNLLPLADRFGSLPLKRICEDSIASVLTPGNSLKALRLAHDHSCSTLKPKCLPLIQKDLNTLIGTPQWSQFKKDYPDLSVMVLESYVSAS